MSGPGGTRPDPPALAAALADVMRAFAAAEVPLAPEDLLDGAWLARWLPPPSAPLPEPPREAPQPLAEAPEIAPPEREHEPDPLTVEPPPPAAPEPAPAGDAVGLTLPRAGAGGAPGRHFRAPTAPALPRARELSRALRPLARRVPSRVASVLDVAETVRRFADARVCDPARRPARERWLTLALVTDTGFGADLWADTAREFRTLLSTLGAFRDVRSWCLDTDGPPRLFAGARPGGAPRDARELIDPSGRTLILVLSSCVTAAWRDGSAAGVLERWARRGPVLLVPLLPENLWPRTAFAAATLVRATAAAPGAPGAQLRVEVPGAWPDDPLPKGVPVPVAVLTPASLRRWAGLVVARPGAAAPALILGAQEAPADATLAAEEVPGAERVALFRREASPLARRLAGLVAAAPVLNLPIVRLIRRSMLPAADQPHEAEVLFGGLLARAPGASAEPRFEFRPGVRAALLDAAPTDESLAVLAGVSDYLGEHLATGATFASVFADPSAAAGVLAPDESPFAQVAAEVLVRAGGDYARMVRRAPLPGPGAPLSPAASSATGAAPPAPRPRELDELPLGYESAPDPDEHRYRRAAALVIGIGQYAHPDLPPLPSACADAVAVAERLGDPSTCRFFPHSIAVLTDEVATREAIDRHLWNWLAQEAHGAELVVLYFAGYCANGYLLPHDADPHSPFASAIPIVYFAECVNRLGARATLVCLDSHPDPRGMNRSTWWVRKHLGHAPEGDSRPRYLLVSSEEEQPLLAASDGPHSLFAWHLLKGIGGAADRDGDGRVGAAELCKYVAAAVTDDGRRRGARQAPWFVALAVGDDIISTVSVNAEADPHAVAPEGPAEYWDELPNKPEEPTPAPVEPDEFTSPLPPEEAVEVDALPRPFGQYNLLKTLGMGGMGTVYRAQPLAGGPEVALKALHRRLTASAQALWRFTCEYEVLQRFRHPGVVAALDFGQEDGTPYFTMELVPGKTLDAAPPRDRAEAGRLIRRVAEAMEHVHAAGVVHRDLKLSNIIVRPDGAPVVLDFGIARTGDAEEADEESSAAPVGTLAYMSPEQLVRGPGAASPLSDVYALGAGLYKLLTGRLPFQGTVPELIPLITQGRVTPPTELVPDLDPRLNAIVLRALAFRPEDRFPSMAAFAEALAALEDAPAASELPTPAAGTDEPAALFDSALLPEAPEPPLAEVTATAEPPEPRRPRPLVETVPPFPFPVTAAAEPPEPRRAWDANAPVSGPRETGTMLCPLCLQLVERFEPADGPDLRCPRCHGDGIPRLYPNEYAGHPPVPVCLVGPWAHGKTMYLNALLHELDNRAGAWPDFSYQWMDQQALEFNRYQLRDFREGRPLAATVAYDTPAHALRLRGVPRVGGCQLIFHDASGEVFGDVERFANGGRHIRHARAVVWLVSLPDLDHPGQLSDLLTIYALAMEQMGGSPKEQTAILALTKCDQLLHQLPESVQRFLAEEDFDPAGNVWARLDEVSAALQGWLVQTGQGNFVNALRHQFKRVRFCAVSAVGGDPWEPRVRPAPRGVLAPLFWLWRETLPTVTVEAGGGRETYFSLGEAVAAAPPGATVRLGPHLYHLPQRLEITKPLVIAGHSPEATTVVCADPGFVLDVGPTTGEVRVVGATVRHLGERPADVIRVVRGALALESCFVSGGVADGQAVSGDGVVVARTGAATIAYSSLDNNKGSGLTVRDQGSATVRDSRLTGNGRSGLAAFGGSVTAHSCTLSKNGASGAHLGGDARCVLVNNSCKENARDGVRIGDTATAELRENYCRLNGANGIAGRDRGRADADKNTCPENRAAGVLLADQFTGRFHATSCNGNGGNGIVIGGTAAPTVSASECRSNAGSGILYTYSAAGVCENNLCQENGQDGIQVSGTAAPRLSGNEAHGNGGYGFQVVAPAAPTVDKNNQARDNRRGQTMPRTLIRRGWWG